MPEAINPYGPPHERSNSTASLALPIPSSLAIASRTMACVLAVGATLWAMLCVLPLLATGLRGVLIFGPGYIITLGYYWRAIARPSLVSCRTIWGFSLLIQGAWLLFLFNIGGFDLHPFSLVIAVWWTMSTAISLAGLLFDPGEEAVDNPGY